MATVTSAAAAWPPERGLSACFRFIGFVHFIVSVSVCDEESDGVREAVGRDERERGKKVEVKTGGGAIGQRTVVCFSLSTNCRTGARGRHLPASLLLPFLTSSFHFSSSHLRGHDLDNVARALQDGRHGGEASLFFFFFFPLNANKGSRGRR